MASGGVHSGVFTGVRLPAPIPEYTAASQHPCHGGHTR
uniref:Uncharacterized protein n=1 Tax=Anguilla anguilla TaxID=7936 RepID=A0A0E9SKH3_ANGAN